ncbi:unnamed protein product [Angiostrongylus costaricensis]|uniref:glucuronosyltransferase n=1 Tax=Angiostrongylus costaricensis TaxID=334426 RepID=A0A158PDT0_ANGCS|nr:unnamed protein product [Angiostrongylus costaricensis]
MSALFLPDKSLTCRIESTAMLYIAKYFPSLRYTILREKKCRLLINDISAIMAHREELEVLKNYGFDAAFAEQIDFCGIGVIRYIGIKNLLWISTTPIMDAVSYNLGIPAPPSYVPTIEENDNNDIMTFWQRAFNIYMYIGAIFIHRWSTNMMTEIFRKVDPDFPNIREIASNASLCFVNIDEMFDLPRPIIQKNVYIGGLGVQKPKPLDQKFSILMEKGEKGVIIVSLGTIAPFHAFKQVTKVAFANVFKSMLDYHFILKIEKGRSKEQRSTKFRNLLENRHEETNRMQDV